MRFTRGNDTVQARPLKERDEEEEEKEEGAEGFFSSSFNPSRPPLETRTFFFDTFLSGSPCSVSGCRLRRTRKLDLRALGFCWFDCGYNFIRQYTESVDCISHTFPACLSAVVAWRAQENLVALGDDFWTLLPYSEALAWQVDTRSCV